LARGFGDFPVDNRMSSGKIADDLADYPDLAEVARLA
jgi:hypothetical protein